MPLSESIRVLHVTEASNAGVGAHVLDLMEGLAPHGVDAHLAYSPNRVDDHFRDRLEQLPRKSCSAIVMKRAPHWSDVAASRAIQQCIDRYGPFDVIHAHSTKAGGLCRVGRIPSRAKVIYTPHGIYSMNPSANGMARRLVRAAERNLADRCHAVIAVSPEEQRHMTDIGIPEEKIKMIANGLKPIQWPSRHQARQELGIDQRAIVFGFLGRLASQKNPLLLIRAFSLIKDVDPSMRLAIVGIGPLEAKCRELAKALHLEGRIDWLGFKTAQQTMPAFDVFVIPSNYEGMPYVMMEAVSLGLPVIATRVGGTSLGIDQGFNGFVVPLNEPQEMAEAMRTLLNPRLRQAMSDAARIKSAEFCYDLMVQRIVEVYFQSLNRDVTKPLTPEAVPLS